MLDTDAGPREPGRTFSRVGRASVGSRSPKGGVFLFEDDDALAEEVVAAFAQDGLHVTVLAEASALRAALRDQLIAVLILDRMVWGCDSLDLLAESRAAGDRTPVLVVSSLSTVDDRIRGLKAGGDDYLVKPFAMGELIARVAALRRRADAGSSAVLTVGPLTMDLIARKVTLEGLVVSLLPREFALLEYLMRHAGEVVTRAMLLEDVWHYRLTTHTNVVDVHVGNLRHKIEVNGTPRLIASVRGLGFKLIAGNEA